MTVLRVPLLLSVTALASHPLGSAGQEAGRMRSDENFRREPNGVVLGRLASGFPVRVVERSGNWLQADVEGWVWLNSLRLSDSAFDLVVSAGGGENLRSGPGGSVVGRLEEGTLLEEIEREPGWAHVRRRGWIWSASVEEVAEASGAAPGQGARAAGASVEADPRPPRFATVAESGAQILTAPDGDTLAFALPGGDLEVTSREGNWARVRVEGWMWMPEGTPTDGPDVRPPSALVPGDLIADPSAHVGRVVSWDLQFLSLERAEAIRTDFRRGEPFLLTRFGGSEGPFVYVAVPVDRLSDAQGLVPLEGITVTGRIRTGASALTGTPIIDLLGLETAR